MGDHVLRIRLTHAAVIDIMIVFSIILVWVIVVGIVFVILFTQIHLQVLGYLYVDVM